MSTVPTISSLWQHYNGVVYRVVLIANSDSGNCDKYPVTVVYQGVLNHKIWSRPLSDWYRSMTPHVPEGE